MSPFSLPPRMEPAVRLSANPKPLAAPCVLAFAASRRLGHEDSKPAEDEQASRAAIIHEEYAHMSADEDSSSSSDESIDAEENSAAASLLTRMTFNEGRGRDGRPISKKRMKKHERLNGCAGSVETLESPLWRMQTARAALPKVRGRSLFRI